MEWIGVAMIVGGLGMAAASSHLERKSNQGGSREQPSEHRDTLLMKAAIGVILAGVALLGVIANVHR
jgi:hypothetical protein